MKHVILLRHAKSAWDNPELDDHDRPLGPRGKRDAPRMGAHLAAEGWLPDLIVTSSARRARRTARRALKAMRRARPDWAPAEWRKDRGIYDDGAAHMRALVAGLPQHYSRVMLVGHQPDLQVLLEGYTGEALHSKLATCAAAVLQFDVAVWSDTARAQAQLRHFMLPRSLGGKGKS